MKRTTRKLSAEHKAKIAEGNKGKVHTPEQKAKISESLRQYWANIPE
ncbi:hypothetical protein AGMMS49965_25560 [Bacteroidia bacterium]|nr:hypothetical protein AGMMS49965_25560 [Bacteroidia bacterium]